LSTDFHQFNCMADHSIPEEIFSTICPGNRGVCVGRFLPIQADLTAVPQNEFTLSGTSRLPVWGQNRRICWVTLGKKPTRRLVAQRR
jgi:hypothetical protein